jgi:uncharacterized membrane protein
MALPNHVEDTVNAIAQLHARHDERASLAQRIVEATTAIVGSARALAVVLLLACVWISINLFLPVAGFRAFDPPPFQWLELMLTMVALLLAILILATQRRADALADSRERVTLEAVLTTDQKTSKIVQLIEELRRDMPTVPDRIDPEAHDMSKKVAPDAVLGALDNQEKPGTSSDGPARQKN